MQLALVLFGSFQITWMGQPVNFPKGTARALLAYLAAGADRQHSRELLASMLWPEQPQAAAYTNLRQTLARVRRTLPAPNILQITPQTLQFQREAATVDLVRFEDLLADYAAHAHADLARCPSCIAQLQEAVALYRGDLLHGLFLEHSQPFEEWLFFKRETAHRQVLEALHTLTRAHEALADYAQMRHYAAAQVALEPWREEAHSQLMRALAYSGQRVAALAQYEACRRILDTDLGVAPSSEISALYEQIRSGALIRSVAEQRSSPPPYSLAATPAALPTACHNAPAYLTNFIGRAHEIADLQQALAGSRLVTLTGAGGCGKTRLALQVAATAAAAYPDGAWLVELASLVDPNLVPQTVASGLGLREVTSQPLSVLLANELRSKRLLLVLDNCEHVIEACTQLVEQLLHTCAYLTILATSREVLGIIGERVWHVSPLAVPGTQSVAAPDLLLQYEGVRLFVERAAAANAKFALTQHNAPAVAQICSRLDGIPLALELVAARVRHVAVDVLAAQLDDQFHLLAAGGRNTLSRHRTLRSTIDWSHDLLSEPEQIVFRRLAVFAGGFSLSAAQAIASLPNIPAMAGVNLIDVLSLLVDKSLLIIEGQGALMRYRLLETMRAYAREKLIAAGEAEQVQDQHLLFFVQVAEQTEPYLFSADQMLWFNRLESEHDNLRAAIDWSLERPDVPAALRLVGALWSFWYTRGHYGEGRSRTLQALALPTAQLHSVVRAKALNAAGAILWTWGDTAEARPLLDQALTIAQAAGDQLNLAWAQLNLGAIIYQQGDYPAARRLLEAGLTISRTLGAAGRRGAGWALSFLGDIALQEGNHSQAHARYAEGAALLRELSDHALLAYPLRRLAHIALQAGDYSRATALCKESLRLNQAIQDHLAIAACLAGLAAIAVAEGQAAGRPDHDQHLRHAGQLCGAVAAQLEGIAAPLWPADNAAFNQAVAAVRAQLGKAAFAAAWDAGHAMALDQVIDALHV